MIAKVNRFHGYNSLKYVLKNGQTITSKYFKIKHCRSRNPNYRLSIVVSKKIHKSAVIRNRIRRRLYELFRKDFKDLMIPADIVVIVSSNQVYDLTTQQLVQVFQPSFEALKTQHKP